MRFTRGELRGLLVLAVIMALLLGLMAWWQSRSVPVAMDGYRLPAGLDSRADSIALRTHCDSASATEAIRHREMKAGGGQKKPGRKRGKSAAATQHAADRPSPLDDVN